MRSLPVLALVLALAGVTGAAQAPPAQGQTPSAADLARRIQTYYHSIADFTADFTVNYKYESFRQVSVEQGDLKVKKPNRMWWSYTAPDRKEYIADGTMFYQYFPKDRFCEVGALPKAEDSDLALLFLAGRGDLTRDFTPKLPASQTEGEWRLTLEPKSKQQDYSSLTLAVRRDTLALTGLVMVDEMGTQTFQFTRFRANRGLKDADFVFRPPRGVEIIKR
jgi:outer membrane lipoprotein carrier protein